VTKLFRDLGRDWRTDDKYLQVECDVFVLVYLHLSKYLFPDQQAQMEINPDLSGKLKSFVDTALAIVCEETGRKS